MDDTQRFAELKERLPGIWSALSRDPAFEHTSVIVPSLSVNQEELAKVTGAAYYEERLLFALIRLRNPNARVIYVTSRSIPISSITSSISSTTCRCGTPGSDCMSCQYSMRACAL